MNIPTSLHLSCEGSQAPMLKWNDIIMIYVPDTID